MTSTSIQCAKTSDGMYRAFAVVQTGHFPIKQITKVKHAIVKHMRPEDAETYMCEYQGDGTSIFSIEINPHLSPKTQTEQLKHLELALTHVTKVHSVDVSSLCH